MHRDNKTRPSGGPDRAGNDTRRRRQGKTKSGRNAAQSPSAPIPKDEALRLQALEGLALLDTPPEDYFDRITRLAARVFEAPVALISLVDEGRQWFKSRCGLDSEQTDRSVAFCAHAILSDQVMVVPDATKDDRFSANPLVTGNPDIRFYAGAPLVTADGHRVGTLCVIDTVARPALTAEQRAVLQDLAAVVVDQFDVRLAASRVIGEVERRKKTQQDLEASENRLRMFIEYAPAAIAMFDNNMRYLAVSRRYVADFRLEGRDVIGRRYAEVFPKSPGHWTDLIEQCLSGNVVRCDEEAIERKDGSIEWLRWECRPWCHGNGDIGGIVLFAESITERKRAENALRASERRYRDLYNKTPVMLHSIDSQGRLISVSDYWLRSMGYTREEVIGRPVIEFLTEESRRHAIEVVLPALMRTGSRTDVEYQFVKKSGEVIDVLLSATSERDAEGTIERALAVSIDVTARKRAEETLRQSERQFRGAFETAPFGMTLVAPDGSYLAVNPAFCELMGYTAEDLLRTGFKSITHPDDLRQDRKYMGEILAGKRRSCQIEKRYVHKQGHIVCVLLSSSLVQDSDGNPIHFVAQIVDLTERRRAEEAMRDLSARVLHAQEDERRRIARDLHDDIGQRLALLSIELDRMHLDRPASATELKARLHAQAERSKEISSDIQLLSRQLHPTRLETLGLVAALEGLCREVSEQSDVQVDFAESEIPEKVPGDVALSLYRIAQEALQNAVKHSGARHASVALRASPGAIRLEMTDSGVGFDVGSARNQGLGLVSMTERARALGGDISVDAGPSRGTRITVRAPLGARTERNGRAPG